MEKILTAKTPEKNTLQDFGGNTYSKNSKYKKNFFLSFLYIKGLNIKMSLISAKGYENAKVHTIKARNDLWVSMKDVGKHN